MNELIQVNYDKGGEKMRERIDKFFEVMGDPVVITIVSDLSLIISAVAAVISLVAVMR